MEEKGFLRETKMSRGKSIGTIAIFFGGQIVFGVVAVLILMLLGITNEDTLNSWANVLIFGAFTVTYVLIHRGQLIHDWKRIGSGAKFWKQVLLSWVGLLALSFLANLIIINVLGETGMAGNQEIIENLAAAYPVMMVITAVIFAPFVEEIVFRLAFMKFLERWPWVGIIVSSLVFGLMHVVVTGDYIFLLSYAAMGIPLGYVYYKTGNIWYPIAVHFIHNFYAMTMMFLLPTGFY